MIIKKNSIKLAKLKIKFQNQTFFFFFYCSSSSTSPPSYTKTNITVNSHIVCIVLCCWSLSVRLSVRQSDRLLSLPRTNAFITYYFYTIQNLNNEFNYFIEVKEIKIIIKFGYMYTKFEMRMDVTLRRYVWAFDKRSSLYMVQWVT